jgi:hypothetical protein
MADPLLNTVKLTDSQMVFWACISLYQYCDTQEETFDLARYFAENVGLAHTFPENHTKEEKETANEVDKSTTTQELTSPSQAEARNPQIDAFARSLGVSYEQAEATLKAVRGVKK